MGLGEGRSLSEILGTQRGTSEGAFTANVVLEIARRQGVEVPIVEAVNEILEGRASIDGAIGRLLQRPTKSEF